jgi:signal transduction histidine kinase
VRIRSALLASGIAFGLAVEWAFYSPALGPALTIADFTVGCMLLVCGTVASQRRPESRVGPLMGLAGVTWFLGNMAQPLLYLHRGPLVHLHLSYPTGRLPTRLAATVVAIAYVDALVEPLATNDLLTLTLSALIALSAFQVFRRTSGPARKAGGPALAAALAFAGVLALGAVNRLAGWDADHAVLWAYDLVIATIAVVLLRDLLRQRWTEAVVTGLVVDLGDQEVGTLRGKLARALGDPSLIVGYRLQEHDGYVDDAGHVVELPHRGAGRAVTPIDENGERVAVLVHDEGLLSDAHLLEAVAAAARIAVVNAHLQAEARAKAAELEASRRRIVDAGDVERRRLESELRLGPQRRLESVAALLAQAREGAPPGDVEVIAALEGELALAGRELREFAQGIHPAVLTENGLMPTLAALAEHSPIPTRVSGQVGRLPAPIEATVFFVCSEGLANAAKHAAASAITVVVGEASGRVRVEVADDGDGGADPARGSGLRGLADRVEALGGELEVESLPGSGTRLVGELPTSSSGDVPRASS